MQATNASADKRTDDQPTPAVDLLRTVEGSRTTVRRVREYLEGDRDATDVKHTDWFTTLEYVRDETDVELVLYSETDTADSTQAKITSLSDDGLWAIIAGWSARAGYSVDKYPRHEVEEGFRFGQIDADLVALAEAKRRAKRFAAAHE